MPVIPINHALATWNYQVGLGQELASFTMGLFLGGNPNPDQGLANRLHDYAQGPTSINAGIGGNWLFVDATVTGIDGITYHSTDAVVPAEGGASLNVPQAAVMVSRTTALPGRRFKGRFFTPGPPAAMFDERGFFVAGALAQFQGFVDTFVAAVIGDVGVSTVVLLHSPGISPTPAPTTVTAHTVTQPLRTLSGRRIGS